MSVIASAPAKVIIVGEHFVVEGEPAIAAAINLRAKVRADLIDDRVVDIRTVDSNYSAKYSLDDLRLIESLGDSANFFEPLRALVMNAMEHFDLDSGFKLSIDSKIPVAVGLGSSASVLVASAAALCKLFLGRIDRKLVLSLASKAEEVAHARPSGIDPTIATYGGILIYRKGEGFIRLNVKESFPIIIGVTSILRSTGEMVTRVRSLKNRFPEVFDPLYHSAGHLVIEAARAIEDGDLARLGVLMNVNHGLLSAVNVSNLELEKLVYAARSAGAFGAKITGAGGGGSIIAVCSAENINKVVSAIESAGGRAIVAKLSLRGVSANVC